MSVVKARWAHDDAVFHRVAIDDYGSGDSRDE
jgi:hypothetical protein